MMNLMQLDAAAAARGGNAIYTVGRNGSSYAGKSGDKIHLIVTWSAERVDGTRYTMSESCSTRNDGRRAVIAGADTDQITCASCRRWLARAEALAAKAGA
jgi:hypothetical protein